MGEWRIGRIAPLFLGPPPDNHSTFYSWSQLLLSLLRTSKCYNFLAVTPSILSELGMAQKGRALSQNGVHSLNHKDLCSSHWCEPPPLCLEEKASLRWQDPVTQGLNDLNEEMFRNQALHLKWKSHFPAL